MDSNNIFSLKKGSASAQKVYSDMKANLIFNTPEAFILMCAIVIASVGLNIGSTAVVIGAMLISPIMGPIQTIGFSLATGNKNLLFKASKLFILQMLIALFSSTLYFMVSPVTQASSEIIARTSPAFGDVVIAIFGGLAGIIGVTRCEKTNVIPGVAIATALMPPLCTVGFGLAHLNFGYVAGALYLFAINVIFIIIASMIGIALIGMRKMDIEDFTSDRKMRIRMYVLLLIIIIPSILGSISKISTQLTSSNIDELIGTQINTESRKVVSKEIDFDNKNITLIVVGDYISKKEFEQIELTLEDYDLEEYTINIVQNSMKNTITETLKAPFTNSDNDEQ